MVNKVTASTYFEMVKKLTFASLKSRYRKTFAGFLWVILNPLILYGAQSLTFHYFLKLNVSNYLLFLLTGLLPWIFIVQCIEMGTPTFSSSSPLLKAFPVHPLILLLSQILDNAINFVVPFIIMLAIQLYFVRPTDFGFLLLPLPLISMVIGMTSLTWIFSTLQVFWGDTKFVMQFVMRVSFYLTPIFFPIDLIPLHLRWIVAINPFYRFIEPFRACIYQYDPFVFWNSLAASFIQSIAYTFIAIWLWNRKKNEFYFYI
jgi:ABC-type polysaccharide/polyol phosphate export permease